MIIHTVEVIKTLHAQMTAHAERAGIGKKLWEKLIAKVDGFPEQRVNYLHQQLVLMFNGPWKKVNDVWTLPNATDEMWENMQIFSGDDHDMFPEQKMLNDAKREYKQWWVKFKADYKTFLGNMELEEDESPETTTT